MTEFTQQEDVPPPYSVDPPPYTALPTTFPDSTLSLLPGEEAFHTYNIEDQTSCQTILDNSVAAAFAFTAQVITMDALGQSPGVQTSREVGVIFQHQLYTLAIGCHMATIGDWAFFRCMMERSGVNNFFNDRTGILRVPVNYVIEDITRPRPHQFFVPDELKRLWNRIYRPLRTNVTLTFSPSYNVNLDACTHHFVQFPPSLDRELFNMETVQQHQDTRGTELNSVNNSGDSGDSVAGEYSRSGCPMM